MIKHCTKPGASEDDPRTLPEGFKGGPTATRQLAAVEKISVTVMVPFFHERTQDFDSVQVQVRLKVDPRQLGTDFYRNNTEGEKIEALPQIRRTGTATGGADGSQSPALVVEYRSKAF